MATSSGGAEERAADGREKGQGELRICSGQYQRSPVRHLYIIPGYEPPTSPALLQVIPLRGLFLFFFIFVTLKLRAE